MSQRLCSKSYLQFFNHLQEYHIDMDIMNGKIQEAMPWIAEEIGLGCLEIELTAGVSAYEPSAVHAQHRYYEYEGGFGAEEGHYKNYQTGDGGSVEIRAYPRKGISWDEEDLQDIDFLLDNLYMISGRTRMNYLMVRATLTDSLTGLSNTNGFMKKGQELLEKGILCQYNCAFINLKNFKYINQQIGNKSGDIILSIYSKAVSDFLLSDELMARSGGDNFVVLFRKERTEEFVNHVYRQNLLLKGEDGEKEYDIISRMGLYPIAPGETISEALDGSSTALAIAKRGRKGEIIWFNPSMRDKDIQAKKISILFHPAIEKREFEVYYQPKVTLKNRKLCGSEALVRWNQSGRVIPPMDFIPVLERNDDICLLDFYVYETVCRDLRRWMEMGVEPVTVSVNFSKNHLRDKNFASKVIEMYEKYEIDPKYLEIELTESAAFNNLEVMTGFVNTVRERGFAVSIDDFGSGYSTLGLLKKLKIDVIKIDKSLIDDIENRTGTDEIIVKNVVNMVNELGMEVIAEGVESEEQASFLKNVNCTMAQGYLFDKPLPREEYEKRLTNDRIYEME